MLEQVKAAFPGAECSYSDGYYYVKVAGHTGYFSHSNGGWAGPASCEDSLEEARDAWYKQLKDEARKSLDDLRKTLRVPEAPPKAPVWGDLVFEALDKEPGWHCKEIGLRVVRDRVKHPVRWCATLDQGYRGYGENPQEALTSLHRALKASKDHHAWYVKHHQHDLDAVAKALAKLGKHV